MLYSVLLVLVLFVLFKFQCQAFSQQVEKLRSHYHTVKERCKSLEQQIERLESEVVNHN
jgi:thiamine kinase-like enzyme